MEIAGFYYSAYHRGKEIKGRKDGGLANIGLIIIIVLLLIIIAIINSANTIYLSH